MTWWLRGRNLIAAGVVVLSFCSRITPAAAQSDWRKEWERVQAEARKEGLIVAGIPARAELRKELERVFKPKFGIDMDLNTARGPQNASRIAAEFAAGTKYFDVFMGGSGTYESLVEAGAAEPLDKLFILPEVRDAKNWWGGHIWEDNLSGSRHLYSYIADAGTGGFWYNTGGKTTGATLIRRFSKPQVERTHRLSRSADAGLGPVGLVIHVGYQGRGLAP